MVSWPLSPIVTVVDDHITGELQMDRHPNDSGASRGGSPRSLVALDRSDDDLAVTRLGLVERLGDPYLTDHDRWVLRQFAQFLAGVAPGPDPRVVRARATRPLHGQSGWTRV
jgi:hypothetical protein